MFKTPKDFFFKKLYLKKITGLLKKYIVFNLFFKNLGKNFKKFMVISLVMAVLAMLYN